MRKWLLIAMLAATSTPALAAGPCIRHDDIHLWTPINDRTILVQDYRNQKAMLKLIGTCSDLIYHEALAIQSYSAAFGLACIEQGDTIITRNSSGFHGKCAIVSILPYSGSMNRKDWSEPSQHKPITN